MPKPHDMFKWWRPDEVAECMSVGPDLYARIWNVIVPKMPRISKDREQATMQGMEIDSRRSLARWWKWLTVDEQTLLNELASEHEAESNAAAAQWSSPRGN